MAELIPAASALIIREGKILFVRSKTTQERWGFPGGKREKEETPQQTASREVKEELGIDIEITGDLGSYVSISGNQRFEIKCLVAEAKSVDLRVEPGEIIEAKWCTLKESLELNLTLTTREALQKFASNRQLGEI